MGEGLGLEREREVADDFDAVDRACLGERGIDE